MNTEQIMELADAYANAAEQTGYIKKDRAALQSAIEDLQSRLEKAEKGAAIDAAIQRGVK